ncbi:MAG: hypothetical protein NUV54_01050 [Candidatus Taylorbacteria bacterium]|nr:hypothetical protein [Candidatus Taylorbacteria bacterium]
MPKKSQTATAEQPKGSATAKPEAKKKLSLSVQLEHKTKAVESLSRALDERTTQLLSRREECHLLRRELNEVLSLKERSDKHQDTLHKRIDQLKSQIQEERSANQRDRIAESQAYLNAIRALADPGQPGRVAVSHLRPSGENGEMNQRGAFARTLDALERAIGAAPDGRY